MPFYVDVLRCADGTYYTGHTEAIELERRLHGWSRAREEALMHGDFEVLPRLSMNRQVRQQHALALRQAQGERDEEPAAS